MTAASNSEARKRAAGTAASVPAAPEPAPTLGSREIGSQGVQAAPGASVLSVYLAAPYGAREMIRAYADELRGQGIRVTSSWLDEQHDINPGTQGAAVALSDQQVDQHAQTDIREVRGSDLLVLFTAAAVGVEGGGGRHVETGIALALGKPVVVVGAPENVFHRTAGVVVLPTWRVAANHLALLAHSEEARRG